jgi:hypothetical protein
VADKATGAGAMVWRQEPAAVKMAADWRIKTTEVEAMNGVELGDSSSETGRGRDDGVAVVKGQREQWHAGMQR